MSKKTANQKKNVLFEYKYSVDSVLDSFVILCLFVVGIIFVIVGTVKGLIGIEVAIGSTPIFVIGLIIIVVSPKDNERFIVYEDKIEVRCPYGIKNTVYFDKVSFVEETQLVVGKTHKTFYIFVDDRPSKRKRFNECFNNKKYCVRIEKTEQLSNFVINVLKLEVRYVSRFGGSNFLK